MLGLPKACMPLLFCFVTKELKLIPLKKKKHHLHFTEDWVEKYQDRHIILSLINTCYLQGSYSESRFSMQSRQLGAVGDAHL